MTVKSRIEIALLLPALPDARDACVQRLSDLLKATDEAAIRAAVQEIGVRVLDKPQRPTPVEQPAAERKPSTKEHEHAKGGWVRDQG